MKVCLVSKICELRPDKKGNFEEKMLDVGERAKKAHFYAARIVKF